MQLLKKGQKKIILLFSSLEMKKKIRRNKIEIKKLVREFKMKWVLMFSWLLYY